MAVHEEISGFLNDLFIRIRRIEEDALAAGFDMSVSATEINIIEKIGPCGATRMGDVSGKLGITLATLTVACDKLENKGLIVKKRSREDKRAVHVSLTEKGMMIYRFHENFHRNMIDAVIEGLTDEEVKILGLSVKKLEAFFDRQAKNELSDEASE